MALIAFWRSLDIRLRLAALAVVAAIILPVAWYLGSPLFITRAVNETFPLAAQPTQGMAPQPAPTAPAIIATPAIPAAGREPTSAVAAAAPTPTATADAMASPTASPPAAGPPAPAAPATTSAPPTPTQAPPTPTVSPTSVPAGPVALVSGEFGVVDGVHKGAGRATVYLLPDGRRVLRLEGFSVTNGPDLYVCLSSHPAPRSSGQLHAAGAFEVARLKGNVGDQNYELPADLDLSALRSAVIYCKRFTTVFSTAELVAAR